MSFLLSTFLGLLSGYMFVELTYRLAGKGRLYLYILSLPVKLLIFAIVLYTCYAYGNVLSFLVCILGFLLGFFLSVVLRGFVRHGRPEGT